MPQEQEPPCCYSEGGSPVELCTCTAVACQARECTRQAPGTFGRKQSGEPPNAKVESLVRAAKYNLVNMHPRCVASSVTPNPGLGIRSGLPHRSTRSLKLMQPTGLGVTYTGEIYEASPPWSPKSWKDCTLAALHSAALRGTDQYSARNGIRSRGSP